MQPNRIVSVGRRKTSVARVFLSPGSGKFTVNNKTLEQYFPLATLRTDATKPLDITQTAGKYDVKVTVEGGGWTGQVGAIRLGISRALVEASQDHRTTLRAAGLMTRDPRMVERKKYGQKKARKRFQFSKR